MGRPIFYVERFDGTKWTTLMMAPHQVGPSDLRGLDGIPGPETPGNLSAFSGLPGCQARVRLDGTVLELFDWALQPVNPLDPGSDMKWGWKSVFRNYQAMAPISGDLATAGYLSVLG